MDRFVEHPVIGICFLSGKVGATIGFAVEGFGPAEAGIDAAHFGAVFVEQQF